MGSYVSEWLRIRIIVADIFHRGGLTAALEKSNVRGARLTSIDPKRIALSGGSAGSNLACSLATMCVSRPLPNHSKIAAQALLYPALNLAVPYAEKLARVDPARVLPQWMSRFFLVRIPLCSQRSLH